MIITSPAKMEQFGRQLGAELKGGEVIELVGDIGAGKTTLTRGLAQGLTSPRRRSLSIVITEVAMD